MFEVPSFLTVVTGHLHFEVNIAVWHRSGGVAPSSGHVAGRYSVERKGFFLEGRGGRLHEK